MSALHPSGRAFHARPPLQPGRVLVLLAHPALHRSRANRRLAAALRGLDGITLHDLYESYPEHDIDVPYEKALLDAHDVIVWQHPFYWYSTPPILKEWQDLVLEWGWAYGPGGEALRGKTFLQAISTGGRAEAYQPGGFNRYTMRQLLAPVEQTAFLCGMRFLPPFVVHGTHKLTDADLDMAATDWRQVALLLRDGAFDLDALGRLERLDAEALERHRLATAAEVR